MTSSEPVTTSLFYHQQHTDELNFVPIANSTVFQSIWNTFRTEAKVEATVKPYVPMPWNVYSDNGLWAATEASMSTRKSDGTSEQRDPIPSFEWSALARNKAVIGRRVDPTIQLKQHGPPSVIVYSSIVHSEILDDDNVSQLHDNPDVDDEAILPQPTIDVLESLFQAMDDDDGEWHCFDVINRDEADGCTTISSLSDDGTFAQEYDIDEESVYR